MPRQTMLVKNKVKVKISKVKRTIKGKTYEQRIIYVPQVFADVDDAILTIEES